MPLKKASVLVREDTLDLGAVPYWVLIIAKAVLQRFKEVPPHASNPLFRTEELSATTLDTLLRKVGDKFHNS
ncbi:hypothetical protein IWQ60_003893 [Tieghemiomyces parasiticus]|uniref:Uncharacterized protein n=1 Tax=Tieghemiomyces parasiticus TaxID=78921 RepID=A0A9W8A9B7_9FUNG|nr:hypothetical protein IWQ60_003893 [Tieghemiomyces parasiticus]